MFHVDFSIFPTLSTGQLAVAFGTVWMQADVIFPSYEATRIAAIFENIGFPVVAAYANIIWSCGIANTAHDPYDIS